MDRRLTYAGLSRRSARLGQPAPAAGASTPNPEDAGYYGSTAVADYDFDTDAYLTLSGSDITVVEDRVGAFDLTFTNSPTWNSTGGSEGGGAAVFVAANSDYGTETGFNLTTPGSPGWDVIGRYTSVAANQAFTGYEYVSSPQSFATGVQPRVTYWRMNGDWGTNYPHNVDYGTPDTSTHCWQEHSYSTGFVPMLDGTAQGTGAIGGTAGTNDEFVLGKSAFGQYASFECSRVVNLDTPTTAARDAVRADIWEVLFPSIGWA